MDQLREVQSLGEVALGNTCESTSEIASCQEADLVEVDRQIVLQLYSEDAQRLLADKSRGLEVRLCRQLTLAHDAVEKLLHRGMSELNTVEAVRLTNAASRLMSVFQQGFLALRNMHTGNDPRITVQQVNVSGGNTVVATSVSTGAPSVPVVDEDKK